MPRKGKKPQLRVCSICNKPGHNKVRCPSFFSAAVPSNLDTDVEVQMYIHEKRPSIRSPHVVQLRQQENIWEKIGSFAPDIRPSPFEYVETPSPLQRVAVAPSTKKKSTPKPTSLKIGGKKLILESRADKRRAEKALLKLKQMSANRPRVNNLKPLFVDDDLELKSRKEKQQPASAWIDWPQMRKLALRTAIAAVILIIPFKAHSYYQSIKETTGTIAANGTEGFMALQESTAAIMQSDYSTAEDSVVSALVKFDNAVEVMNSNHRLLQKIVSAVPIVSNEVQSRQKIITAGQKIALGNTFLIKGLTECQKTASGTLTKLVKTIGTYLTSAIPSYEAALTDLAQVDPDILPLEYQNSFKDFRLLFSAFLGDLENLVELGNSIEDIFGGKGLRRYLIVFQNPHEIRPTGGFIGSFAVLDVKDGQMARLDIPAGGSYDLQGQLTEYVEPPTPLLLSNKRWEFQDANWFPDFPSSAEKILWFYRHSRNMTADGVIAINATVLERLLSVLGPVQDANRSLSLSSTSALATIQQVVEEGPEKQINKPKQIIADLAPQFINLIYGIKTEQILPLLSHLSDALEQKEVQAFFTDKKIEDTVNSFGWGGKILPIQEGQDYLMVINTNIQGQKTDAEIKQTISHEAVVSEDGTITDTVIIGREHTGTPGEKLYGQTNIDYIRIYVPHGAELISAGGFIWPDERKFRAPDPWTKKDEFLINTEKEIGFDSKSGTRITEEFGKTVFGNWLILQPGESRQIQFTYRLPFKTEFLQANKQALIGKIVNENYLTSRYQLAVQRQSGQASDFESQIIFPADWHPSWNKGDNTELAQNGMLIEKTALKGDAVWSLLMRRDQ